MKKNIIHHRSPHHSGYSGYACLIDFMRDVQVIQGKPQIPYKLAKCLGELSSQKAGIYNSQSVQKEIELLKIINQFSKENPTIIHYLNGERDIRYLIKYKISGEQLKFCASFHKPPEVLEKTIQNTTYLKKLNGAICVGRNQVDFIKEWLKLKHVEYIPHGVDTSFFEPLKEKPHSKKILFVGQHLRDFEMLNNTMPTILAENKEASLDIILKKEFKHKVNIKSTKVSIHSGIDDFTLKKFYQKASFLYLPMLDSTACNSILEGIACGLPIITSDVGGNRTYLEGTGNFLIPKENSQKFIATALHLLSNPAMCEAIGKQSRALSLNYDWNKIAEKIESFYKSLFS